MNSKELELYRDKETGLIDVDKFFTENKEKVTTVDEDRGTAKRDKKWIQFEDVDVLVRDENLSSENVNYTAYQELVFEELAKQVNFPCAHYDIGKRGDKKCVFSYNIVGKKEKTGLSMMSLSDLMDQIKTEEDYSHSYNIVDAFKAIGNHCKVMNIDKSQQEKVLKEFCKMQVLDTFLSSSDRHCENISFLYGKDKSTGKNIFELAPVYDNELSCGSEEPEEKMVECLDDYTQANMTASLQVPCATVPESEQSYEMYKKNKNNPSAMLLQFVMELDEDAEDFAQDCLDNLNMPLAIKAVEERIDAKLPDMYKEFLVNNYMIRKTMMNKAINEFYKIK